MFALVDVNNMYVSCEAGVPPVAERGARVRRAVPTTTGACIARSNEGQGPGRAHGPTLVRGAASRTRGGSSSALSGQLRALRRHVQSDDDPRRCVRAAAGDLQHRRVFPRFRRRARWTSSAIGPRPCVPRVLRWDRAADEAIGFGPHQDAGPNSPTTLPRRPIASPGRYPTAPRPGLQSRRPAGRAVCTRCWAQTDVGDVWGIGPARRPRNCTRARPCAACWI